jgi:hypothetical protein
VVQCAGKVSGSFTEESKMTNVDEWITIRINEARKDHDSVIEAVLSRTEQLLRGLIGERQLTTKELASIAQALLSDTVPKPPRVEEK